MPLLALRRRATLTNVVPRACVQEFAKLDEKSTLVYISEYYYGINEQFKKDLAGKRITKLISFTKQNDEMKQKYLADCRQLDSLITAAVAALEPEPVGNTMKSAVAGLERTSCPIC